MSDAGLIQEYDNIYYAYVQAFGSLPRGPMRLIVMQTASDRLMELIAALRGRGYTRCTHSCPREHWYRRGYHGRG